MTLRPAFLLLDETLNRMMESRHQLPVHPNEKVNIEERKANIERISLEILFYSISP